MLPRPSDRLQSQIARNARVYCQMGAAYENDDALLLSGDPEDFGRFYDRYVEALLAFFQRRTRDPEAAADLTAETFAAALVARGRYQARATPAAAWLFGIAQHKLTDFRRRGSAETRMRARLGMERMPVSADDAEMIRWLGEDVAVAMVADLPPRSEEHTSELQSQSNLVCRLLLEKKK